MSNSLKGSPSHPLARELAERELAACAASAPSRPCLPAVEQLGDRITMSADPMSSVAQPLALTNPPPQVGQILIGMMKGDIDAFAQDLAALKLAASVDPKLGHKLADALHKVDLAIYKLGRDMIKGEAVAPDIIKAAIDKQFLKIDAIVARHPADAQLKIAPTLDALQLKAQELVTTLAAVGPAPDLLKADRQVLNKISLDWKQMTTAALKLQEQTAFNKTTDNKFLEVKLSDVLVSSLKVEDATLKTQIESAVGSAEQILIGLLLPASTGDVIRG